MTGVVESVSIWLKIRPPTIAMPSGRRSSEPVPPPRASGRPPRRAAIVVIVIGRNRRRQAWKIASSGFLFSLRSASIAKSIIRIAFFLTMPMRRMMPMSAFRSEPQEAGLEDRVLGLLVLLALGLHREVDHQNRVLLDDADEKDDADERDHAEVRPREKKREERAHARRRQRREDRDRVDQAFVQDAEDDVDRHQRRENEKRLVGERLLERLRRALVARANSGRDAGRAPPARARARGRRGGGGGKRRGARAGTCPGGWAGGGAGEPPTRGKAKR